MIETNRSPSCLNCTRMEDQIPLVAIRYLGREDWICSQCFPILIHKPHELAGKLERADKLGSTPEH